MHMNIESFEQYLMSETCSEMYTLSQKRVLLEFLEVYKTSPMDVLHFGDNDIGMKVDLASVEFIPVKDAIRMVFDLSYTVGGEKFILQQDRRLSMFIKHSGRIMYSQVHGLLQKTFYKNTKGPLRSALHVQMFWALFHGNTAPADQYLKRLKMGKRMLDVFHSPSTHTMDASAYRIYRRELQTIGRVMSWVFDECNVYPYAMLRKLLSEVSLYNEFVTILQDGIILNSEEDDSMLIITTNELGYAVACEKDEEHPLYREWMLMYDLTH